MLLSVTSCSPLAAIWAASPDHVKQPVHRSSVVTLLFLNLTDRVRALSFKI
jgi:hypothetical protein